MNEKKESIVTTVNLKQDIVNSVDTLASELGVKPNRLIGNLMGIGLDEIKALKKYRILNKGLFVMSILEQYGLIKKKDTAKHIRAMNVSIRIDKGLNEELEKWAIELGMTKNAVIVWCIKNSLLNFQTFKDLGIFKLSLGLVRFEAKVKEVFNEAKIKALWKERFKEANLIANKMTNVEL